MLAAAVVTIAAERIVDAVTKGPSIDEQLEALRIGQEGRRLIAQKELRARGAGTTSYLLILRDERITSNQRGRASDSDEVRIVDRIDDELRTRFSFRPSSAFEGGVPYAFHLAAVKDFDGDGLNEIVGAWSLLGMGPVSPHPVLISWRASSRTYRMFPLIPERPRLARVEKPGLYGAAARRQYKTPAMLRDVPRKLGPVRAYSAEDYLVESAVTGGATLGAAYIRHQGAHAGLPSLVMNAWMLRFGESGPLITPCAEGVFIGRAQRREPRVESGLGIRPDYRPEIRRGLEKLRRSGFRCY